MRRYSACRESPSSAAAWLITPRAFDSAVSIISRSGSAAGAKRPFPLRTAAMMQAERNKALAPFDRALDDRPDKIYDDLAEAVRCVAALRDRLVKERRAGA